MKADILSLWVASHFFPGRKDWGGTLTRVGPPSMGSLGLVAMGSLGVVGGPRLLNPIKIGDPQNAS